MSGRTHPEKIEPKKAEKLLDKIEKELRDRFDNIFKEKYNPPTKGGDYEDVVADFFKFYLGEIFSFETKLGVCDIELKADSIFGKSNEFDVVAIYKDSLPKLMYRLDPSLKNRFVNYDSVAFIVEVKQSLSLKSLEQDLKKFKKLDGLRISGRRFQRYADPKYLGLLPEDYVEKMPRPFRILFYYKGLKRKSSREEIGRLLFIDYKDCWDLFLVVNPDPTLYVNHTLPVVKKSSVNYAQEEKYPIAQTIYIISQFTEGYWIDTSLLLWNLLQSHKKTS